MQIREVQLENIGVHDAVTFALNEKGAYIITGPNGSGKSSFVEGVALALWGESLRGEPLWRANAAGFVKVRVDINGRVLSVTRKRTKAGAKSLTFHWHDETPTKYETPSKAQEALEGIIGSFDTWARTCVLSSADSAHFSLATDGERKRLLERLLGLDRLDIAASLARQEQRTGEQRLSIAENDERNAQSHVAAAEQRHRQAVDALAAAMQGTTAPADAEERLAKLRAKMTLAQDEMDDANAELEACRDRVATTKAELAAAERRAKLAATDACPTCEQPIPTELKQRLTLEEATAREAVQRAATALTTKTTALNDTVAELSREIDTIRNEGIGLKHAVQEAAKFKGLRDTLEAQRDAAATDLAKRQSDSTVAHERTEKQRAEVALSKTVAEVFGLKGVRAHLLDRALTQIQKVANRNLRELSPTMRLELTSTTDKKTGGTSDAIALRVSVDGGDSTRPYASLSAGERRRVDVAMLLALADVAAAASGRLRGTLWMDEVFDALDGDGAAAVGSLIERLGSSRSVVVITHSDALVRSINGVRVML